MRNFDETNITDAVLARVSGASSPRTRQLGMTLVRHLHAFVKEIEPTQAEWSDAIDFLTRVGHMCSETRQEFILLPDVLGVSMLVDAINHRLTVTPPKQPSLDRSMFRTRLSTGWARTSPTA